MSETEAAWVEESRRLTLTVVANLASLAARSGSYPLGSIVRDLSEQAQLWAELPSRGAVPSPRRGTAHGVGIDDDVVAEAATYAGRCAAGLRRRMELGHEALSSETARLALACAADLDEHLRWADLVVRALEQSGRADTARQFRVLLPSRAEFTCERLVRTLASVGSSRHPPPNEDQGEHAPVRGADLLSDSGRCGATGRAGPGGR